jgi:hypothetical protein
LTANLSHKTFRTGLLLATLIALAGLVLYITGAIVQDNWVLPWYTVPTNTQVPLFLQYFELGSQPIGINLDQIVTWQQYQTGDEYLALPWLDHLLLAGLFVSLVTISVTLTYLSRFWYLLCTGIMLFILMQLQLSEIGFLSDYISYAVLIIFGGTTYFFQSIKTDLSLFTRSLSILLIYTAFVLVIGQFSEISAVASVTISYGLYTPLLLTLILMLFVGADNVYSLFTIATKNAPTGKNGLIHFMSIGAVYILVLVLLFLNKIGEIDFSLLFLNPYVIFVLSLASGYYCINDKLEVVETALPLTLIKKWLYSSLAGLALILIGYAELNGNDSLSEMLQMSLLLTQLGGAAVFYIYVFINFAPSLLTNESVEGRFFKGERAPLLTGRILHIVFIVGIFYFLDKQPYFQARAARYNALAMVSQSLNNEVLSRQYYKEAAFYDYYGFKPNYALAMMAEEDGNLPEVVKKLSNAMKRDTQGKAVIALAGFYSSRDQLFRKLLTLKEGPEANEKISNNLALTHYEFQQPDSAFMAFQRADQSSAITTANLRALDYFVLDDPAMGLPVAKGTDDLRTLTNIQAIANKLNLPFDQPIPLAEDTVLVQETLFYLFNQSLNLVNDNDEAVIAAIDYYLSNVRNQDLRDFLLLGRALRHYQAGKVNLAFQDLNQLTALYNNSRGQYTYLMGIWAAQQGAYIDALQYLEDPATVRFAPDYVAMLRQAIGNGDIPLVPHPASWNDQDLQGKSSEEQLTFLKDMVVRNSFNVPLTLRAVEVLKEREVTAQELYELLRQAISINRYNLELTKAFAFQAVESGLTAFGRSALLSLTDFVAPQVMEEVLSQFEAKATAWRDRLPD